MLGITHRIAEHLKKQRLGEFVEFALHLLRLFAQLIRLLQHAGDIFLGCEGREGNFCSDKIPAIDVLHR